MLILNEIGEAILQTDDVDMDIFDLDSKKVLRKIPKKRKEGNWYIYRDGTKISVKGLKNPYFKWTTSYGKRKRFAWLDNIIHKKRPLENIKILKGPLILKYKSIRELLQEVILVSQGKI